MVVVCLVHANVDRVDGGLLALRSEHILLICSQDARRYSVSYFLDRMIAIRGRIRSLVLLVVRSIYVQFSSVGNLI